MSRKQQIILETRRILGTFEGAAEALGPTAAPAAEVDSGLESLESFGVPMAGAMRPGRTDACRPCRSRRDAASDPAGARGDEKDRHGAGRRDLDQDQRGLEAIVLLAGRPAILIQDGDFMPRAE